MQIRKRTTSPWRMAIPSRCARGTNCSLVAVPPPLRWGTAVAVLTHRADRHRPGFDPGAGVAHPSTSLRAGLVGGADEEGVALVRLAYKGRLGLSGVRQPGGPGPTLAHFVLDVVVAQAGEPVLAGPGHLEAQPGRGRGLNAHGGRNGVPGEVEGLGGRVAGAVAGGDGQRGAYRVAGVEGVGLSLGGGRRAVQAVRRSPGSRLGEGPAEARLG
jgi:hypothetical protein